MEKIKNKNISKTLKKKKEMQIKIIIRYDFAVISMAVINKTNNKKCWQVCEEIRTIMNCC